MPNLEVLSLSVNKISTLKDIKSCLKIKELYLRKNFISDISEVKHLVDLPELKVLWLCDNPCS
jgi:Leucine-rich repeat (LRR) protein